MPGRDYAAERSARAERKAARLARTQRRAEALAQLPIGAPRGAERPSPAPPTRPRAVLSPPAGVLAPTVVTAARAPMEAQPKRPPLESEILRRWAVEGPCELAGVAGHNDRPHLAGDPHHVWSRGAGGGDLFVAGVCREGHGEAHAGSIPRVELEAAAWRTLRRFVTQAPIEIREAAIRELFGIDA